MATHLNILSQREGGIESQPDVVTVHRFLDILEPALALPLARIRIDGLRICRQKTRMKVDQDVVVFQRGSEE